MSNKNNNIEQDLKLCNQKLAEFIFRNETRKLKSELNNIFNILINSEISQFSEFARLYLKNIINILFDFISKNNKDITLCIMQEIYFLLSNIKSKELLKFIFSCQSKNEQEINMNIFDKLISINDFNENEEFLNIQINLMKSLVLKLDSELILFFYKEEINFFPILTKSLLLYDHPDSMLRSVVYNILLLITKNKNKSLNNYLSSFPVALYYPNIIYNLKNIISQLNFVHIKEQNISEYFEERHEELYDSVLYINDILLCDIENINFILINCLLNEIIFPLFNIITSKTKENISVINAIYILSFFVYYIKNDFIINIISFFLINENIPSIFYEKIKKYKFNQLSTQFLQDINYLIKNIIDADVNDSIWKRNSDFIINDIGIDLSLGNKLKENNFDFFKEMMINIKENKCNDIDFIQNEILVCNCELMSSIDENIILNIIILYYNVINYYMNLFKNNFSNNNNEANNSNQNDRENRKIYKINDKNKNYINNNQTLFNPFLSNFINFTKIKSNISNKNLLKIISKIIKKRNKFRIFTTELIMNTLLLLIKIFCFENNNYITREVYNLIKDIKIILKEETNNLKNILNTETENFPFNIIFDIYKYHINQTFDSKLLDIMKSYYMLIIPFMHLEKNSKIPLPLMEEKSNENNIRTHLINIFLFIEFIDKINNKSNKTEDLFNVFNIFNIFEIEKNQRNNFEIGNIYNKNNIGNEYGFCFIGDNYDDFNFNVEKIKKCLFIFKESNFYLAEIISKTFKNISEIKIIKKIDIISLQINKSAINDNYLEIKNLKNDNKIIMNCFNNDNTKKTYNYLTLMKNNFNDFLKNEFNNFIQNIENKFIK